MSFIKTILIPLLFCSFADANQILKTKNQKALIKLTEKGVRTGTHFEVLDHYGHLQGVLRITRTHKKKAIGIIIAGKMKPKWTLEETTNKQVLKLGAVLKNNKAPARSIASVRRARKKALTKKLRYFKNQKRKINRKIAQIEEELDENRPKKEDIEYAVESDSFFSQKQNKTRQEESASNSTQYSELKSYPQTVGNNIDENNADEEYEESPEMDSFRAGILYRPAYKTQNISKRENITLSGFSYNEPRLFVEGVYKSKISVQASLGYSEFLINETSQSCQDQNCRLVLGNTLAGLEFKITLLKMKSLEAKAGVQGNLIYPVKKSSNIIKKDLGLYGDLGITGGIDLLLGSFVVPLYLGANLVIPPTQKVKFYSIGLTTGLGWRF